MPRDYIPVREADLVTFGSNFGAKITATPTVFGLTASLATANAALNTAWTAAYNTANDPLTRSPTNIVTKNAAKDALIANIRMLAGVVQKFPAITDTLRSELGLTVPAQPSPNPPPGVAPAVEVVSVSGHSVSVRVWDSAKATKRGKPANVLGANIYSFVGAVYPTDPTGWQFEGTTTKNTFDVVFPDTVANGAQVWICATWFNKRTQTGPISMPVTTNVQFGGMSQAA